MKAELIKSDIFLGTGYDHRQKGACKIGRREAVWLYR
jgi:hypothetical protein